MISLNMTPARDNQVIWIIVINDTIKLSYPRSIILSATQYDGAAIQKGSLSGLSKNINFVEGNNIGQVGIFTFQIARYSANAALNDFFNEFYPDNNNYITNRIVKVGVCWDNALLESQITWLEQHFIRVYSNTPNVLNIECVELAEVESKMVPPYIIDNQPNDLIHVPDEQTNDFSGSAIPIVYGSYPDRVNWYDDTNVVPALLFNKSLNNYFITCHKCFSITANKLYTYHEGHDEIFDLYDPVTPGGFDETNSNAGYKAKVNYGFFFTDLILKLLYAGYGNQASDLKYAADRDINTYATIPASSSAIFHAGDVSDELYGSFNDNTDAWLKLIVRGTGSGTIRVYLREVNIITPTTVINELLVGTYAYNSSTDTVIEVPFDLGNETEFKELFKRNFRIQNITAGVSCGIKEARLIFSPVTLNGITKFNPNLVLTSLREVRGQAPNSVIKYQSGGYDFANEKLTNVFASCTGMMFGRWIDNINGVERDNGLGEGLAIHNLSYTIESIIRDYILTERNLIATAATPGNPVVKCTALLSSDNNYYVGAIYINPQSDHKSYITAYNGATKEFTLAAADPDMTAFEGAGSVNARFYLTNIKGNEKVNYQSFDSIGGPSGNRSAWLCRGFIDNQEKSENILNKLLFESACILQRTDNKYKLIALETTASTVDTWTIPLYDRTRSEYIYNFNLTPIEEVYSAFVLNYDYDAARRIYKKQIYVNVNGYSSGSTVIGSAHQTKCKNAEINYLIKNKVYSYDAKYISDRVTAENLLSWIVDNYTCQKPLITWGTDVEQGIKYEIGDQVKLNNLKLIPAALNNNTKFIITSKQVNMLIGAPYIVFNLTVLRGL